LRVPPFVIPLLLFLAPILELYLLLRVADHLGAGPTVLLVIATALLGIAILRRLGFSLVARLHAGLAPGAPLAAELGPALLLVAAGILLVVPGPVTDAAGFALLVPQLRRWIARRLAGRRDGAPPPGGRGPVVIEGEFERRPDGD
jgi:UPF0716 protein FxsA